MLKFEKYQGAGNDFVIFSEKDLIEKGIPDYSELAKEVCDRHYGIGADGMIILNSGRRHIYCKNIVWRYDNWNKTGRRYQWFCCKSEYGKTDIWNKRIDKYW